MNLKNKISFIENIIIVKYGYNFEKLKSISQTTNLVYLRYLSSYLLEKYTNLSLNEIGSKINRDHSTVHYGINKIKIYLETNKKLSKEIIQIKNQIENVFTPKKTTTLIFMELLSSYTKNLSPKARRQEKKYWINKLIDVE